MNAVTSLGASLVVMLGCANDTNRLAVEANSLGITHIEVVTAGESLLELRGVDDHDAEVARLRLRTGQVAYSYELGAVADTVFGTELVVTVGSVVGRFVSPGSARHSIGQVMDRAVASFVRLAAVAAELDVAGITLDDHAAPAPERAYQASSGFEFPTARGTAYQACTWWGFGNTVHALDDNVAGGSVGYREIGTACHNQDGSVNGCTTNCYYGGCGYHVVGTYSSPPSYPVVTPYFSNDDEIGCEWSYSSTPYVPYYYFPPVSPACTCTGCDGNGNPTPSGCYNVWNTP